MNASSRKVLKEVRFGLLITEPDVWGSRVRRGGFPGTKRVLGRSRFSFRCHDATNRRKEREREGERDNKKSPKNFTITSSILKNPKIFKKSQKVRSNAWNAWKRRIRTLTKWKKTWSRLKNPWGWSLEWEKEVWEVKRHKAVERDLGKWNLKSRWINI